MLRLTKKGLGNYLKKFKNEIFGQTTASELSFISENIALFLNHEITEVILSYNRQIQQRRQSSGNMSIKLLISTTGSSIHCFQRSQWINNDFSESYSGACSSNINCSSINWSIDLGRLEQQEHQFYTKQAYIWSTSKIIYLFIKKTYFHENFDKWNC